MSRGPAAAPETEQQDDQDDRVEWLHDRLVELEVEFEEKTEAYEERIADLEATVEAQQQRLDDVDERTDVLQFAKNADNMDATQRRAALLLHLKREAENNAERGGKKQASVTQEDAARALYRPGIDRTTWYTDFTRIEEWIENKTVCKYVSASGGDSRLRLNLEDESLIDDENESMPDHVRAVLREEG